MRPKKSNVKGILRPLTDEELRYSTYVAVLMALLVPPLVGATLMGLIGFYPIPEVYLIFTSYTAPYVIGVVVVSLFLTPRAVRFFIQIPHLEGWQAQQSAKISLARLPLYMMAFVTSYSVIGALSADFSLEALGIRQYGLREHFRNQFGLIPVVLITAFPIFFYYIDRLGRYLGPRGVHVTAVPLWVKMLMLGIVTPMLIDSVSVGYFVNRTGHFEWQTVAMWLSLMALAVGGTWLAWKSLQQGIAPLHAYLEGFDDVDSEKSPEKLIPFSLDEFGVLAARFAKLLEEESVFSENLQHTQSLSKAVVDNAGVPVLVLNRAGGIILFNRACEHLSGCRFEDVQGKKPWDTFLPPEDASVARKLGFDRFVQNPNVHTSNYSGVWLGKAGERHLIEWTNTPIRDARGDLKFLVAVGADITERKKFLQQLQANETRLNEAQRIARVGSWELDLVSGKLYWTDEIFNLFEIDKGQFPATYEAFLNAIHPEDRESVNAAYTQSLKDRSPYTITHRLEMADGQIKWVEERCKTDFDADGKPLVSRGTVQDITERKRYETALVVSKQEAEAANRAKSEFLANMSHEIRTPMNAILGLTQLVLDVGLPARQQEFLRKVHSSAHALLGILNDILDYSKIEAGFMRIDQVAFNLEDTVQQLVHLFDIRLLEKGLALIVDIAPDVPKEVLGDPLRLSQVLTNLLSNAIKFTEKGDIRIKIVSDGRTSTSEKLRFSIIDTGIGLSEEMLTRLFQPFSQADNSTTRKYGGTGLGLSICQNLVKLMGGDITVSSVKGKGAAFTFNIKVGVVSNKNAAPTRLEAAGIKNVDQSPLQGLRILLVEDNEFNCVMATEMLEQRGVLLRVAVRGVDAIEQVKANNFDVVLMDLHMPEMDGVEATRRIHEIRDRQSLPVIAVTAAVLPADRARCAAAGMVDFIPKPIDPELLVSTILKWVTPKTQSNLLANKQVAEFEGLALPETLPGVDLDKALSRLVGNKELLVRMLREFAQQNATFLTQLDEKMAVGERVQAATLLHTLRGVAATLGAITLAETAGQYELEVKQGKATSRTFFVEALGAVLNGIKTQFATTANVDDALSKDGEILAELLRQLIPYLQERELIPGEMMDALLHFAHTNPGHKRLDVLIQQLDQFDHDAALTSVADLLSILDEKVERRRG